mgnify:FL=1
MQVALAPKEVLQGAVIAYGTPLLAILVAVALAYLAGWSEPVSVIAALVVMTIGIGSARIYLGRRRCLRQFMPVVTARLGSG